MEVRNSVSTWRARSTTWRLRLAPEHVLASAAIPGAFPAVEIRRPRAAKGWYGDGGVRLNAPLKPALALGADRVVVIGLNSPLTDGATPARPDAVDGAAQLLQVVLGDQIADDVATLAAVNETLVPTGSSAGAARERHAGRRTIPYIFIAPSDRLAIGRLARDVYKRRYAGIAGLVRDTDLALLGRIVSAERSAVHGELLSYLFLAREFIEELIALGRRDAERWLQAGTRCHGLAGVQLPRSKHRPAGSRRQRRPGPRAAACRLTLPDRSRAISLALHAPLAGPRRLGCAWQPGSQRVDVPSMVAASVDEERWCAGDSARIGACHVIGDPRRLHVMEEVVLEAVEIRSRPPRSRTGGLLN